MDGVSTGGGRDEDDGSTEGSGGGWGVACSRDWHVFQIR